MFKKNKRRTDSTYLDYKNGKILDCDNPDSNKDYCDVEEDEFNSFNESVSNNPNNKKSKILIIIGSALIIAPLIFLGVKACSGQLNNLSNYMTEGEDALTKENDENKDDTNNKKPSNEQTQTSDNNSTKDEENNDSLKDINKISPKELVLLVNSVNSNITLNYNNIKTEINFYIDGREGLYSIQKSFDAKRSMLYKNYEFILSKETLFTKADEEELYTTLRDRYANIINTLDNLKADLSRSNCISVFNEAISLDSELFDQEYKLITNFLDSKNVDYTYDDTNIVLK